MKREEMKELLFIMQTAYPRFYSNQTSDELVRALDLWSEMFANDDATLVAMAVKQLITTLQYPPTIADVKNAMYKLTDTDTDAPIEVWNAIKRAIGRSSYYSQEEFDALPDMAKQFVGTPRQLKEWAISENYNDDVIRSNFLKQYEVLKQRKKDSVMMLPTTKAFLLELQDKMTDNQKYLN